MSKKINDFLREIVRIKILFWWLNVDPSSFVQYGCFRPNKFSRLRFGLCFWPGSNSSKKRYRTCGCAKTFLDMPRASQHLADHLCATAIRINSSTSLEVSDEVRITLVDWKRGNLHCVPIQHPGNPQNRPYNLLHFVVLVLWNSIIVFWSSMSFRLTSVSKVELWNFRKSSISVRFCWWTSRKSFCCRHSSSCRIQRSSLARAAWISWWPILSQCSTIIVCLYSSSKILIDRQKRLIDGHTFRTAVIGLSSVCFGDQLAERTVVHVQVNVGWRGSVGEKNPGSWQLVDDRVVGLITCEGNGDVVGVVTPLRGGAQVVLHGVQVVEVGMRLRVHQEGEVEEDGEGQVEVEKEENEVRKQGEVKENRTCSTMEWCATQEHLVPMTQLQNKTTLRAPRAVLTRAARARIGLRQETCWCNLCHVFLSSSLMVMFLLYTCNFCSQFSVIGDVLFTPTVGDGGLRYLLPNWSL